MPTTTFINDALLNCNKEIPIVVTEAYFAKFGKRFKI
jgi:hypothetical protein